MFAPKARHHTMMAIPRSGLGICLCLVLLLVPLAESWSSHAFLRGTASQSSRRQGEIPGSCVRTPVVRPGGTLALRASIEDRAKAWRLQQVPGEADASKWRSKAGDRLEEILQDQISTKRERAGVSSRELDMMDRIPEGLSGESAFSDGATSYSMTDEDLEESLALRFSQISGGIKTPQSIAGEGLTGMELAELCVAKYGVAHDMAIKCDKFELVSDKKLVSLNLYYAFYGQLNPPFPYSELTAMAGLINSWGQADYVREFFKEKPTAYRGLPSRPRWDTAVSIRLYKSPTWNPSLVEDFFVQ